MTDTNYQTNILLEFLSSEQKDKRLNTEENKKSYFLFNSVLLLIILLGVFTLLGVFFLDFIEINHLLSDLNSYSFLILSISLCTALLIANRIGYFEYAKQAALFFPVLLITLQFILEHDTETQIGNLVIYSVLSRMRFVMFALLFLVAIGKPNYILYIISGILNVACLLFFEELHALLSKHDFPENALGLLNYVEVRLTFAGAYAVLAVGILRLHNSNAVFSTRLGKLLQLQNQKNHQLKEQKEEIDNINESLRLKQMVLEGTVETLDSQNMRLQQSMNYASRIQQAILPNSERLHHSIIDSAILYKPKDIVSGDFYWQHQKDERHIWYCVADCTGHGIPGAFMSILGMQLLNQIVKEEGYVLPNEILSRLNELLRETLGLKQGSKVKDGMDISLCYINLGTLTITLASAKQSVCWLTNDTIERIRGANVQIGQTPPEKLELKNHTLSISYEETQRLFMFSDGFQDQFGGNGRKYGSKQFRSLLKNTFQLPLKEQIDALSHCFTEWKEREKQTDDVTVMGIQF